MAKNNVIILCALALSACAVEPIDYVPATYENHPKLAECQLYAAEKARDEEFALSILLAAMGAAGGAYVADSPGAAFGGGFGASLAHGTTTSDDNKKAIENCLKSGGRPEPKPTRPNNRRLR